MVIDQELERHRETWIGFTRFMKYSVVALIILLGGMAIGLL